MVVGAVAAQAQTPPENGDPITPLLVYLGPATGPACANGSTGFLVVQAVLGPDTSTLSPALQPVFQVCGDIPRPGQSRTCELDQASNALVNETITALFGPIPANTGVLGPVADEVAIIERAAADSPAGGVLPPLSPTVDGILQCTAPEDTRTTVPPPAGGGAPSPTEEAATPAEPPARPASTGQTVRPNPVSLPPAPSVVPSTALATPSTLTSVVDVPGRIVDTARRHPEMLALLGAVVAAWWWRGRQAIAASGQHPLAVRRGTGEALDASSALLGPSMPSPTTPV